MKISNTDEKVKIVLNQEEAEMLQNLLYCYRYGMTPASEHLDLSDELEDKLSECL